MAADDIHAFIASRDTPIRDAARILSKTAKGLALITDEAGRLTGSITDGDIRRHQLKGGTLDAPCSAVMNDSPRSAPLGTPKRELRDMMQRHMIWAVPLVDTDGRPVRVVHVREVMSEQPTEPPIVIMAGGEGRRLRPLTKHAPKPMMELGGAPILESIVRSAAASGMRKLFIAVNYRADVIERHFEDGHGFGVEIAYLRESESMGTAGALSLLPPGLGDTLLVINGDVVTHVDWQRLAEFHWRRRAVMTVGAVEYKLEIPYGVLRLAESHVLGVDEKPTRRFLCSAGIYAIESSALRFLPGRGVYHMTDLLEDILKDGLPVSAFPIHEYWVDIGRMEDLERARDEWRPDSRFPPPMEG